MTEAALDAVATTAHRVGRFAQAVEDDPTPQHRVVWRGAMRDFQRAVRAARSAGWDGSSIHEAAGGPPSRRFVRHGLLAAGHARPD